MKLMNTPFLRESDLLAKTLLHTVLVMMMLFVHILSLIICTLRSLLENLVVLGFPEFEKKIVLVV